MARPAAVTLPLPEPIALLDATLLFLVQVLIARHPQLLAPPEEHAPPTPGLRAARRIFEAVRDLHTALGAYRAFLPADHPLALGDDLPDDDNIPF